MPRQPYQQPRPQRKRTPLQLLSIANSFSEKGGAPGSPYHAGKLTGLIGTGNHSCCELMQAAAVSCAEASTSRLSSPLPALTFFPPSLPQSPLNLGWLTEMTTYSWALRITYTRHTDQLGISALTSTGCQKKRLRPRVESSTNLWIQTQIFRMQSGNPTIYQNNSMFVPPQDLWYSQPLASDQICSSRVKFPYEQASCPIRKRLGKRCDYILIKKMLATL